MINDSMKSDKFIGMIQPKNIKDLIKIFLNYIILGVWEKLLVLRKPMMEDF